MPRTKAHLCTSCGKRPKLSVLSKCVTCLTAEVEKGRKEREERKARARAAKGGADPALYPAKALRRLCGAKTRAGHPCKRTAMITGGCKSHFGLGRGPRRPEAIERVTRNLYNSPTWQKHRAKEVELNQG